MSKSVSHKSEDDLTNKIIRIKELALEEAELVELGRFGGKA